VDLIRVRNAHLRGPDRGSRDRRRDYGERRIVAIGIADCLHLTVVYTDRTTRTGITVRRIISARRSNRRERTIYESTIT
jgi:uncharacterized DUF497 family protein